MTEQPPHPGARSYGCTFGCGRPYDFILVSVSDGDTQMVCLPCFIGLARDMILALTEPENEEVIAALALAVGNTGEQVPGPRGKPGKRNAPATSHDDGIFDEFDDIIETEELRDAFG